ncbi:hypothetical protein CRG98_010305 [Punica granatum]|uniref:Uncharacterized protein n=1 Tax=Punica granatum TaxID=22663 RepID=A0A2I0KLD3_PUNGR|nr:hypothetical protein CRG98_010305 [Punica granatum]
MLLGGESVTGVEARALGRGRGAAAQSKQLLKRKSNSEEPEPRTHGHGASSSSETRNYGLTCKTRRKQKEMVNRDRTDHRRQEKSETGLGDTGQERLSITGDTRNLFICRICEMWFIRIARAIDGPRVCYKA